MAEESFRGSTPGLQDFDPTIIPYQYRVLEDIRENFDYSVGVHEVLLSGSVGSAKSILMAHAVVTHCLMYPRARACLGRKSLGDLKSTIFQKILEHIEQDLVEGVDYWKNESIAKITFRNGSEIISRSWSDKRYKKGRSLELSCLVIEELTENNDKDKEAYDELRLRVGRLPHIKENFVICATNPDAPSHWAYKHFIQSDKKTRHVYYSVTTDNPFLPDWYIDQIKEDYDAEMVERMVYGRWIEIRREVIYYAYRQDKNFITDRKYKVDPAESVHCSFDFNIAKGKPMSSIVGQYLTKKDEFHYYREFVVPGFDTWEMIAEMLEGGVFDQDLLYVIHGDATGKNRHPASKKTNYEIIEDEIQNYRRKDGSRIRYQMKVRKSNPPIKKRHDLVNGYCKNSKGRHRLFLYGDCEKADEGMRLTALKEGANYIEDDSKDYQHITTAIGYDIFATLIEINKPAVSTSRR